MYTADHQASINGAQCTLSLAAPVGGGLVGVKFVTTDNELKNRIQIMFSLSNLAIPTGNLRMTRHLVDVEIKQNKIILQTK